MTHNTFQWDHFAMGTCYYPEHWDETLWESDLERMLQAGISTIRIAEFAWSKCEPREGVFTFDYWNRFLDLCEAKGMKVIFGTPTATPPAWLTTKYPEVLNCRKDGVPYRHGSRRHYNYNSPIYNRLSARIVRQIASHYAKHPAIVGWQIDNELNCETHEFYSEADTRAFRAYLKDKFCTLDRLNDALGTTFWNQTYTAWEELRVPGISISDGPNPHLMLEYYRFVSESCIRFCAMQADIIREYAKEGDFITTNGRFQALDNHRMAREHLNTYTFDTYPNFSFCIDQPIAEGSLKDRWTSLNLTEVRSICPHFGIMEQQSGANGWTTRMEAPSPRPGQIALWAMQSVAHGADYVSFFRWRTCSIGTEIYWHGILDYDNRDNRKLREVAAFHAQLQAIDETCGADFIASFALVKDYDNVFDAMVDRWHARVDKQSSNGIFEASARSHTPMDIVYLGQEGDDRQLAKYPVVIYPHPVLMNKERAATLKRYVENGGTLIIGCRAGYKDMQGHCVMMPQPGLLQELTGTDIHDFTFTSPAEPEVYADWNGTAMEAPLFNDVLTPIGEAKTLAAYSSSYYAGEAALVEHRLGKGKVLHWGSVFTCENTRMLLEYVGALEPFTALMEAPEEVELVKKVKNGHVYIFALNFAPVKKTIRLKKAAYDLIKKENAEGELLLPAFGVAVYRI